MSALPLRLLLTTLPLVAATAACDGSAAGDGSSPSETAKPQRPAALEVVPVVARRIETTLRLPGELAPYETVALHARVQGFVEEVLVDRGSVVKKGQLLARLVAPELQAQRAEAQARAQSDRATYEHLRAASATPGVVAQHDVEIAQGALAASDAKVKALRDLEDYLLIRAPFAGVITERNVHPGALVGAAAGAAATPLLRLEQVALLRLTVAVPEADAGAIAEGHGVTKAEFTVRAWPGKRFVGTIQRVSHVVDEKTRSMPVELDVDNRDGQLAPGMFAEVAWPVRRAAPSLLVPPKAIAETTERAYVDRVKGGMIERVPVERGLTVGDQVEVFGALAPGDEVLRRGSEELKDGAKVETRPFVPDGGAR